MQQKKAAPSGAALFYRPVLCADDRVEVLDELIDIAPDKLVVLYGNYNCQEIPADRRKDVAQRIKAAVEYAKNNGVEVEEHDANR